MLKHLERTPPEMQILERIWQGIAGGIPQFLLQVLLLNEDGHSLMMTAFCHAIRQRGERFTGMSECARITPDGAAGARRLLELAVEG